MQSLRFRPRFLGKEGLYQLNSVLHLGHVALLADNCLLASLAHPVASKYVEGNLCNLGIAKSRRLCKDHH